MAFLDAYSGAVTAVAAIIMAVFTIVLARVTGRQAKLARAAIALARDEFNATHRPKLAVRDLTIEWTTGSPRLEVAFAIANTGEGAATIIECDFKIRRHVLGSTMKNYENGNLDGLLSRRLLSGERIECKLMTDITPDEYADEDARSGKTPYVPQLKLRFEGFVTYDDRANIRRRSSFYREFDFAKGRFGPGDDPQREYAD